MTALEAYCSFAVPVEGLDRVEWWHQRAYSTGELVIDPEVALRARRFSRLSGLLSLISIVATVDLGAQAPDREESEVESAFESVAESSIESVGSRVGERENELWGQAVIPEGTPASSRGWRLGNAQFIPQFTHQTRYDDNVLFQTGDGRDTSDIVHRTGAVLDLIYPATTPLETPSLATLSINYQPGVEVFQDGVAQNNVQHDLGVTARREFRRLDLSGGYRFVRDATPGLQEGGRVVRTSHTPGITAVVDWGARLDSTLDLGYDQTTISDNIDIDRISGNFWTDYRYSLRTQLGVGVTGGQETPSIGTRSVFEQFQGRLKYQGTTKLQFELNGGLEFRQFDGDADSLMAPVFGLTALYSLSEATLLTLQGERALRISNFVPDQVRKDLTFTFAIQQRFLQKYFMSASYTLGDAGFESSNVARNQGGDQTYSSLTLRTWREFENGLRGELFYTRTERGATAGLNALENNMAGISLTYSF